MNPICPREWKQITAKNLHPSLLNLCLSCERNAMEKVKANYTEKVFKYVVLLGSFPECSEHTIITFFWNYSGVKVPE